MGIEQRINNKLNAHPGIKKGIKRVYQLAMYAVSPKVKSEGHITRLSPDDNAEYFFGYYDKSPWDATGRYVICLRAKDTWSSVAPQEPAVILLIDTQNNNHAKHVATTRSWNVQQGCMMQWLGPDFDKQIIYNDFRDGKYCSVILDVFTGEERQLSVPVYSVSRDGKTALTLDFARLHRLRPGYGYSNLPDSTANEKLPNGPCIWKLDLTGNMVTPLLTYKDLVAFRPRSEMKETEHKVNHIMLSPNGQRFMFLHRWFDGQQKYSRLLTCNIDGSDLYALSDDDMVSHCCWKNNDEILAFENKRGSGAGYYLMKDRTQEYQHLWPQMDADGHPSFSPDGKYVVTDTYPDRARVASVRVMYGDNVQTVARVFAPFKYDNETRCDLHPRWSRNGTEICIDSVYEGHRGMYAIQLRDSESACEMRRCKVVFLVTACNKVGPIQQTLNIVRYLDTDLFEPILITLYDEPADGTSQLSKFTELGARHYRVRASKKDILIGQLGDLDKKLDAIAPDVIHSLGVFPDYAVGKVGRSSSQVITLRNYMHDDYLSKFGPVQGRILEYLQMRAVGKAAKVVTCSKSLAEIYKEKKGLSFDHICNGVDTTKYDQATNGQKRALREKLRLPQEKVILVYSASFIPRKNQRFLLETFSCNIQLQDCILLLLGDGPEFEQLKNEYGAMPWVDMRGSVANVAEYLQASDIYISSSKSEGMPNGVLEAMATGLPVVLSDIQQHKEIFENCRWVGELYPVGDSIGCEESINRLLHSDILKLGENANKCVKQFFSAEMMSRKYQELYEAIRG